MEGPNYIVWAQAMSSFLKARKLWRYVNNDINEPKDIYMERLGELDNKNHQIITLIHNTHA